MLGRYLGSAILPVPMLKPLRVAAVCFLMLSHPADALLHPSAICHHRTAYMHSAAVPAFDWPVDLWTSPSDRPEPYGTCGQVMVNIPVDHNLPTLSGLSPTGSTDSQQQEFHQQEEKIYAQVRISWVRFFEHKWVHFDERPGAMYCWGSTGNFKRL